MIDNRHYIRMGSSPTTDNTLPAVMRESSQWLGKNIVCNTAEVMEQYTDADMGTQEMSKMLKNLQVQNMYLFQMIRSLFFFIILSIMYTVGNHLGWISSIKNLFTVRNTQVHPVQERRDNIQVTQADNTQSNKQRENAKSSAFKFETGTISRAKNKSQKNLTIDETWINEKVRECANLQEKMKKRNELARAVQVSCEDIIDAIPWTESSLPDQLIQTKIILETECRHISKMKTGDQSKLRTVLIIVLNRDYRSLLSFVTCMGNFIPHIKENILKAIKTEEGHTEKCPRCLLKERVGITQVVDKLFSKGYITLGLYSKVTQIDIFTESQDELWDKLLDELCAGNNTDAKIHLLIDTVDHLGFHEDIVELLLGVVPQGNSGLQCKCGPQMLLLKDSEEGRDRDSGLFAECQGEESGPENEDQGNLADGQNDSVRGEQNDSVEEGQNDSVKEGQNDSVKVGHNDSVNVGQNDSVKEGQNDSVKLGQNDIVKVGQNDSVKEGQNDSVKEGQNECERGTE